MWSQGISEESFHSCTLWKFEGLFHLNENTFMILQSGSFFLSLLLLKLAFGLSFSVFQLHHFSSHLRRVKAVLAHFYNRLTFSQECVYFEVIFRKAVTLHQVLIVAIRSHSLYSWLLQWYPFLLCYNILYFSIIFSFFIY